MRRRAGGPYGDGDVASCEWESTAEREVGWDTEVVGNAATSLVRFGAIEKALFFSDITFITVPCGQGKLFPPKNCGLVILNRKE